MKGDKARIGNRGLWAVSEGFPKVGICEKGKHPWQETVHNDHVSLSAQIKVV